VDDVFLRSERPYWDYVLSVTTLARNLHQDPASESFGVEEKKERMVQFVLDEVFDRDRYFARISRMTSLGHLREQIMQRVPKSPWVSERSWAA